jgi:hypothetical protein
MYVRVGAGIDLDDDAGEVDERERVDGGLDGREVAGARGPVHHERARGKERAVERPAVAAVPRRAHESHPPRELPLDRLHPRRVHRIRLRGRRSRRAVLPRPQAPRVRVPRFPVPVLPPGRCHAGEQRRGDAAAEEQEPRPRQRGHRLVEQWQPRAVAVAVGLWSPARELPAATQ